MNAAALANSQVAKDALDWYKQAYTDQAPLRQQAAPGGKQIDLISMNGISMAAIAALDKKVGRLSQQIKQAKAGKGIAA